ncbi:GAF and ANTAR domain-containing protein [Nitriliruptor alkaliphilus]|uniref:GAF and ANTAR domain-containing protein n=1 Tax=Nitriliruptor alkaliphilus TaxID=427918 RepID=UPI000695B1CF|nr:GAF and ANTAR domain-containing protein [Nitriliruptor alkaliphilus]
MVEDTAHSSVRERRLVATFVELADTLVEDLDLADFLSTLTERVVELELASEAGILLVDEAGHLQFMAASHERTALLELFQVQNQEGPCHDCFTTGVPVGADDLVEAHGRWPRFTPQALATGFRSVQAVPLRLRGTILGALNLFLTEPGGLGEGGLAVGQAMADVATIGLIQQRELHRSHVVEAQLQHALHSRISIEQAKGIISEQASIPMDGAFELLRAHARRSNRKLNLVARDVVGGALTATDLVGAG